jgi:signal peptidase I
MTEPGVDPLATTSSSQQTPQAKPSSRWKSASLAGLFSLIIPGTGQLYNRQPRKALLFVLPIPVVLALAARTRIVYSFGAFFTFWILLSAWRLFIAAEAAHAGWKNKRESEPTRSRLIYWLVAGLLIVATIYPSFDDFKRWSGFGFFKVPSASMCPTICPGEYVAADMAAYRAQPPKRGDLVMLQHKAFGALLVKRVIGLPGDVVAPGPNGAILVNGEAVRFPAACSKPAQPAHDSANYSKFVETKVPEGGLFVVGDSLDNSFDSRLPDFGPVVLGDVRGRPVFLYWSPSRSRIGCQIH